MKGFCFIASLLLLLPAASFSKPTDFVPSRATHYTTPDGKGTPSGACGYGESGKDMNYAKVTGVSNLWYGGTGCGACYQVKCTMYPYCKKEGVTVAVTDYGQGDRTDFVMNKAAFAQMARPGASGRLISYGTVDVTYRRVPCRYASPNVRIKIHENSRYPDYLSLVLLNVNGVNDVKAIEVKGYQGGWVRMRNAYGAVTTCPSSS
ncbi:PREDICTED: expansin-like B1 [Tarenaya hassleriana]|uniref:expansin-like B1 n=1 Tax=Tarenaya hassleriana TaxID=28532 RepID=UPI00053C0AB9|nr:PREDICTED: expansin-like B1 [Tarenaya hassleriana]